MQFEPQSDIKILVIMSRMFSRGDNPIMENDEANSFN